MHVVVWSCCTGCFGIRERKGLKALVANATAGSWWSWSGSCGWQARRGRRMRRAMSAAAAHACSTVTSYPRMCAPGICEGHLHWAPPPACGGAYFHGWQTLGIPSTDVSYLAVMIDNVCCSAASSERCCWVRREVHAVGAWPPCACRTQPSTYTFLTGPGSSLIFP